MRAIDLAKVAAAAETLRLRQAGRRQAGRVFCAAIAGLFALAALAVLHIVAWMGLLHVLSPMQATLAVLAGDIVLMAIFGALAARNVPSAVEQEALVIRKQALVEMRSSLTGMAMAAEAMNLVMRSMGPRRGIGDALTEIITRVLRR